MKKAFQGLAVLTVFALLLTTYIGLNRGGNFQSSNGDNAVSGENQFLAGQGTETIPIMPTQPTLLATMASANVEPYYTPVMATTMIPSTPTVTDGKMKIYRSKKDFSGKVIKKVYGMINVNYDYSDPSLPFTYFITLVGSDGISRSILELDRRTENPFIAGSWVYIFGEVVAEAKSAKAVSYTHLTLPTTPYV